MFLMAEAFSQDKIPVCGTKTIYDDIHNRTDLTKEEKEVLFEAEKARERAINKLISENKYKEADTTIVIPVVFHIIHQYGPENIPNQTVYATMALLNREYNKLNPGINNVVNPFKPLIANVNIEFRLATKDPKGNCTNGIIRYADSEMSYCKSLECNKQMKSKYTWPRDNYMNCFVVGSIQTSGGGTVQGFSHFPFAPYSSADSIDGNAMIYSILPLDLDDPGGRNTSVTSHEVGHWLGLYHTWGKTDNVALAENCNDDDEVGDTPNCTGLQSVCDLDANTCGAGTPGDTIDNAQNYMDYSHCYAMFTLGQAARMRGVLQNIPHRQSVCSGSNLIATGADYTTPPSTVCKADFMPNIDLDKFDICPGQLISFSDISFHNIKQRKWTFEGGNPAISFDSVPSVTYSTPGKYSVTLEVSDGVNTEVVSRQKIVTVVDPDALGNNYSEGFETIDLNATTDLEVSNPNQDETFQITDQVGYSGERCVMIKNIGVPNSRSDELISNTLNLSGQSGVTLEFKYAFTGKPGISNSDQLSVLVSSNCGWSWTSRKILKGSALKTAPDRETAFYPGNQTEWKTATINLNTYNKPNVRFKIEWISGGGNNLFLDDINLSSSNAISEIVLLQSTTELYPNPSNGEVRLQFESSSTNQAMIKVMTLAGGIVYQKNNLYAQPGLNDLDLNLRHLSPGMYLVSLSVGENTVNQKLLIH